MTRREYYLHKRQNGIFYVEFINPENGKKLSARSTGETDKIKAQAKAEFWKVSGGIPTGRMKKPRPIEEAAGIESVIKSIRKAELNADDALRIVSTLKGMGLSLTSRLSRIPAGALFRLSNSLRPFETMTNRLTYGTSSLMGIGFQGVMPTNAKNGSERN